MSAVRTVVLAAGLLGVGAVTTTAATAAPKAQPRPAKAALAVGWRETGVERSAPMP